MLDLGIGLARDHQAGHFVAQVLGQGRIRIGQGLVLADQAAQFGGQVAEALGGNGLGERAVMGDGGGGLGLCRLPQGEPEGQQNEDEAQCQCPQCQCR